MLDADAKRLRTRMTSSNTTHIYRCTIVDLHMESSGRINGRNPMTMLWMDEEGIGHCAISKFVDKRKRVDCLFIYFFIYFDF